MLLPLEQAKVMELIGEILQENLKLKIALIIDAGKEDEIKGSLHYDKMLMECEDDPNWTAVMKKVVDIKGPETEVMIISNNKVRGLRKSIREADAILKGGQNE